MYGMFTVKLALLLTIIGGVQRTEKQMKIRGISHLLLVGGKNLFFVFVFVFFIIFFFIFSKRSGNWKGKFFLFSFLFY